MSSFRFKPAAEFTERAGLFISLTGSTNSGKTFSALRLARGIAGPRGKVAVLDTEGGRTLHLKDQFGFDANLMDPPFRPHLFAEAAKDAEEAGYDALVIDSFSMEWVGIGGVLDWQAQELQRMAGDDFRKQERMKMASWIKPKTAHKAMVYSLLQRRIPIIFSIRGEETIKPGEAGEKPTKLFKSITNQQFPFEVTVSFRLESERKGYIDLSDPKSWKMEGAHQAIFKHGERISEEHGAALAAWARGEGARAPNPAPRVAGDDAGASTNAVPTGSKPEAPASDGFPGDELPPALQALLDDARAVASEGTAAYRAYFGKLTGEQKAMLVEHGHHDKLKQTAHYADESGGR